MTRSRFERSSESLAGSCALFSRDEVSPGLDLRAAQDAGDFLARLWAHFGPPETSDGGFEYALRDRATGLELTAGSGASGPSYGGALRDEARLRPVVEALEALLLSTQPVECELRYTSDIEYGGGERVLGWKDGRSFDRSIDRRTRPDRAARYDDCVAIAREYEGGYGAVAGWHLCLDAVLPSGPDEVEWNGTRYDNPVGFTIEDDEPRLLYIGDGGSPEGIPLEAVDWTLPPVARLWLDSFARWKRERR